MSLPRVEINPPSGNTGSKAPNSVLRICSGVPLSIDSPHSYSRKFLGSISGQESFFAGKAKYTYTAEGFVLLNKTIKVQVTQDNLLDCNYIQFRNPALGNKNIYAFITGVEGDSTSDCSIITFQIDPIQTYLFDMLIPNCFVVRQHAVSDTIGLNTVEDDVDTGEYIFEPIDVETGLSVTSPISGLTNVICIASTVDAYNNPVEGSFYSNAYSGCVINIFESAEGANQFINNLTETNKVNAIIAVFMAPFNVAEGSLTGVYSNNISFSRDNTNLGSYTPRNRKMFTYPYDFIYATNNSGDGRNYRWEWWGGTANNSALFGIRAIVSPRPEAIAFPRAYRGVPFKYDEGVTIDQYPQCMYNIDSFKAYLAQSASSTLLSVAGTSLALAGSAVLASNPVTATLGVAGGALALGGIVAKQEERRAQPPEGRGTNSGNIISALNNLDFSFYRCYPRPDYCAIIDSKFDVLGYPYRDVRAVNLDSRPSWNFVQLSNCVVQGNMSLEHRNVIQNKLEQGFTFWHGDFIGDYSRSNTTT